MIGTLTLALTLGLERPGSLGTNEKIATGTECHPTGAQSEYQPGSSTFEDDGYGNNEDKDAWHFWSPHSGGAFFVFADGHVKFIPYSIARGVFRSLGTYKGGEANHGTF